MTAPLISCVMVTLATAQRLPFFRASVADFLAQDHARKELVAIVNGGEPGVRAAMMAHLAGLPGGAGVGVEVTTAETLGALRNRSLDAARGDLVCVWDDDDRHHPNRLTAQLAVMQAQGARAVLLEEAWHAFIDERRMFCLNWRRSGWRGLPASLLCRPADIRYPETGEAANRNEDIAVLAQLFERGGCAVLPEAPHLYVYASHGRNTSSADHHRMLASSLSLSRGLLLRREAKLREGLAPFADVLSGVTVAGSNGDAFVL